MKGRGARVIKSDDLPPSSAASSPKSKSSSHGSMKPLCYVLSCRAGSGYFEHDY